ncbi:hypothetical protein, partial [Mycobacterium avium]
GRDGPQESDGDVAAPPPPPPDHRARNIAIGFLGTVAAGVLVLAIAARLRRAR